MTDVAFYALDQNDPRTRQIVDRFGLLLTAAELSILLRWPNTRSLQSVIARARRQPPDTLTRELRIILAAEKAIGRRLRYEAAVLGHIFSPEAHDANTPPAG